MSNIEKLKKWVKENGAWNKGKKWSIKTKKKMSKTHKKFFKQGGIHPMTGKKHSEKTKLKFHQQRLGKPHPHISWKGKKANNWRGGKTSFIRLLRASKEYKLWREAVFKRDNYVCIWCGKCEKLNADHIKKFSDYPELRFAIDNGRTLCIDCHRKTDTWGNSKKYKN